MKKLLIILSLILTTTVCSANTRYVPTYNYNTGYNAGYNVGYRNGQNDNKEAVFKAIGATVLIAVGVSLIYYVATREYREPSTTYTVRF